MTIPFYSQEEVDALLAKERQWIADALGEREVERRAETLERHGAALVIDELADDHMQWRSRIREGNYPRPLVVQGSEQR